MIFTFILDGIIDVLSEFNTCTAHNIIAEGVLIVDSHKHWASFGSKNKLIIPFGFFPSFIMSLTSLFVGTHYRHHVRVLI